MKPTLTNSNLSNSKAHLQYHIELTCRFTFLRESSSFLILVLVEIHAGSLSPPRRSIDDCHVEEERISHALTSSHDVFEYDLASTNFLPQVSTPQCAHSFCFERSRTNVPRNLWQKGCRSIRCGRSFEGSFRIHLSQRSIKPEENRRSSERFVSSVRAPTTGTRERKLSDG